MPLAEADIWIGIKNGSEQAFQDLFDVHWQRCFALSYKLLRDREAAEDLVQDVFVDLWTRKKHLLIHNTEAFLTQMVKNRSFITLSRTRIPERNLQLLESLLLESSPEEKLIWNEISISIESAVEQLPPRCKEVFVLRKYEGLSVDEIAEKLNMSIRTVENHLYQAAKFLRNNLNPVMLLLILNKLF
ncbi:RNA polymerase sigma factor [Pontibacter sp. SGAir0037]|uniref:RNA polymerase sigma factor n=1 Tax=Pontibacter sp. SGAir0037 TaxID=2571030 RepID=UPI0010CD2CDC|nr:RNA polymerase sigma-70 factor [Pontibacter sp. SGAir0037]QCR22256.1 hypothetical protein C1N53_07835 [Pontibacter sp. SGAir0037]